MECYSLKLISTKLRFLYTISFRASDFILMFLINHFYAGWVIKILFHSFARSYSYRQHHLLKMVCFLQCVFSASLSKARCLQVNRALCGPAVLLHWSWKSFHTSAVLALLCSLTTRNSRQSRLPLFSSSSWLFYISQIFSISMWNLRLVFFFLISVNNCLGILMWTAWNQQIVFSMMSIFIILIPPVYEHGSFLCLLVFCFFFFSILFSVSEAWYHSIQSNSRKIKQDSITCCNLSSCTQSMFVSVLLLIYDMSKKPPSLSHPYTSQQRALA